MSLKVAITWALNFIWYGSSENGKEENHSYTNMVHIII